MAHYKGAASEGGRAQILMKKRQKEQEELETRKRKIEEELKIGSIQNKFATHYDAIEAQLKSNTIGLWMIYQIVDKNDTVFNPNSVLDLICSVSKIAILKKLCKLFTQFFFYTKIVRTIM